MSDTIGTTSVSGGQEPTWKKGVIGAKAKKTKEEELAQKVLKQKESNPPRLQPGTVLPNVETKAQAKTSYVASKSKAFPAVKSLAKLWHATLGPKAGVLQTIFFRLRMLPSTAFSGNVQNVFLSVGASLGGVLALITFPCIVANTANTISLIHGLHQKKQATPKNVLRVLFRQSTVDAPLARDVVTLAQGAVLMAMCIGARIGTLAPAVLASLGTAMISLGSVAGGLAILYGSIQTFLGVKEFIKAKKNLEEAQKDLEKYDKDFKEVAFSPTQRLKRLHYENIVNQAHRKKTQAILKACMGTFMTVGGAVGISALFTGGWTAIGIAIAGVVLVTIAIGVQISGSIYQNRAEKRLRNEFDNVLAKEEIDIKNEDKWVILALELSINQNIPPEEREEALRNYCLGKTTRSVVIASHRRTPNLATPG